MKGVAVLARPSKNEEVLEDSITTFDSESFAATLANAASELQATDIVLLNLEGRVAYTDGFVICSGRNRRHVLAIAEAIRMEAKKLYNKHAEGVEGKERGQWVLVDFGDIVVHVFDQQSRGFYDLESLWMDAPRWQGPPQAEPEEPQFFTP